MADVYRHSSGATLGGGDRHTIHFDYRGRRWDIPVEREDVYLFYITKKSTWTDGTPVAPEDMELAVSVIREACAAWQQPCHISRFDLKDDE